MRRGAIILVGAMAAAAVWAAGASPPAGAAVVVTSSGTTLSATVTGVTATIGVSCVSGQVRVLNTPATPSLACTAITSATLTGDGGAQVFGAPFPIASFPALTTVTVNAAGGDDQIEGSTKRDVIVGGTGNDRVTIPRSGADDSIGLGGQTGDRVTVVGTSAGDGVAVSTQSPSTQTRIYSNPWEAIVTSTATLAVNGGAGDDILVASGVTGASTLSRVELRGDDGDDILVAGAVPATLVGGTGANQLTGGAEPDAIFTTSPTDTIRGNAGVDGISDSGDGRVGRTIDSTGTGGSPDNWQVSVSGDVAVRTRTTAGDASITVALGRTGRQILDEGAGFVIYDLTQDGLPLDRALVDLAPLGDQGQRVDGDTRTSVDIVVPTGSWSIDAGKVSFTGPYEDIEVDGTTNLLVRGPYTDPNERFAHRVIRDLGMRLPVAGERNALRNALNAGSTTRAQAVLGLTDVDAYRGLDVDRAFIDILRRTTDAAGRAYWIGRLDDGLVLRRLRANLYGSTEYYADAGNTAPQYVAKAYRDILGRTAGQAEIDYWVAQIEDVGLTKGTVADRFLNTAEARTVVIRDLFLRWVDREPTSGEISTWNTQLGSSSSDGELALIRFLAGSAAYYNRPDA
jgi:Ca2+-binding RTX toxin-like protein